MTLNQQRNKLMVQMNFTRVTYTGHTWSMTENGWRDDSTLLTWKTEDEDDRHTFDDAVAKFRESLPTKEEWKLAEKHGVREVLSLHGNMYWSASVNSSYLPSAGYFDSSYGNVLIAYRVSTFSVRLIVR